MAVHLGFVDGEAQAQKYPQTFEVPDVLQKAALKPGDIVKLGFITDDRRIGVERMWVVITSRNGVDMEGTVDNDPMIVDLKAGDIVRFQTKHILNVYSR